MVQTILMKKTIELLLTFLIFSTALQLNASAAKNVLQNGFYFDGAKVIKIAPVKISDVYDTLPNSFVIKKGTYIICNKEYVLNKEGLYRFYCLNGINEQRIVYEKNVDQLLSGLAWTLSHSDHDDNKSQEVLEQKSHKDKLYLTCGPTANFVMAILAENKIKARQVDGLTSGEFNGFDDGHTLFEVFHPKFKKWVIYDFYNNSYFINNDVPSGKNVPFSIVELVDALKNNTAFKIIKIANDSRLGSFKAPESFLYEELMADNEMIMTWYKRVLQIALVRKGQFLYFYDKANKNKVEKFSPKYKYMEKARFFKEFY
jgi:hypothetical protein